MKYEICICVWSMYVIRDTLPFKMKGSLYGPWEQFLPVETKNGLTNLTMMVS